MCRLASTAESGAEKKTTKWKLKLQAAFGGAKPAVVCRGLPTPATDAAAVVATNQTPSSFLPAGHNASEDLPQTYD